MNKNALWWLLGGLFAAVLSIGALVFFRQCVVTPYKLPTASMEPTIKRGGYFFVFKIAYRRPASVKRGDIVAYRIVVDGQSDVFIKRVIGVPGDHIVAKGGTLKINGAEVGRREVRRQGEQSVFEEKIGSLSYEILLGRVSPGSKDADVIVPKDYFFVMGDNRMNSLDSRYTGCVRFADIIGKKL
jgi:signal peptidase I